MNKTKRTKQNDWERREEAEQKRARVRLCAQNGYETTNLKMKEK